MGPLRLSNLIGLDTLKAVADSMYEETGSRSTRRRAAAPDADAGLLGRKSGAALRLPGAELTTRETPIRSGHDRATAAADDLGHPVPLTTPRDHSATPSR